jgi:hypothetical protein
VPTALDAAIIAGSASITVGLIAACASAWQGGKTRNLQQTLARKQRDAQTQLAEQQHAFDKALAEFRGELERQAKIEREALDAQQALALLRVPLQYAADDLGRRLHNIRADEFLVYVEKDNRRNKTAVLGTAYRFARFFATLEMLYSRAEFLRLERRSASDSETESVVETLAEIGRTFARDRYDRSDPDDFRTSKFMIWREEQRAMAELAWDRERDSIAGFATFATRATGPDAIWFDNFIEDLTTDDAASSERLALIQSLLARLVRLLDPERRYLVEKGGERSEPPWMQPATAKGDL